MNEAPATDAVPTGDGVTAGALLRQAREAAGLHVATLAANLKVPVRKLEALEEDRYDLLPDAVFVRALASSVCRTLKLDPQPVLQRLPQTTQPRLVQDSEGINAPFRAPSDGPSPGWLDQVSRPVVLTVLALLLGALVLILLPVAQRTSDGLTGQVAGSNRASDPVMPPPGAAATVPTAPVEVVAAPGAAQMPASASGPLPTASALTPVPDLKAAAPTPAASSLAAGAPLSAASSAAPAAQPASAAASAAASPASGLVVFHAKGPSWIQVTDARGSTVLRRLMAAGESAGANGTPPLSVTVGDAAQTEVEVRGKAFNLAPVARDNVARFEVK